MLLNQNIIRLSDGTQQAILSDYRIFGSRISSIPPQATPTMSIDGNVLSNYWTNAIGKLNSTISDIRYSFDSILAAVRTFPIHYNPHLNSNWMVRMWKSSRMHVIKSNFEIPLKFGLLNQSIGRQSKIDCWSNNK